MLFYNKTPAGFCKFRAPVLGCHVLNLTPLKRQTGSRGESSDVRAVTSEQTHSPERYSPLCDVTGVLGGELCHIDHTVNSSHSAAARQTS